MATSKTLAPTNVTISIPAMTDAPNASVISNCIDKEADAINALNSQLVKDLGSKTVSDFESAIVTLGNSLGTGGVAHFTVAISSASGVFSAASYIGFVEKITTNRLTVILSRNVVNQTVCGRYNGTWAWDEYALASKMQFTNVNSIYFDKNTNSVSIAFIIGSQRYTVRFRLDTQMISLDRKSVV